MWVVRSLCTALTFACARKVCALRDVCHSQFSSSGSARVYSAFFYYLLIHGALVKVWIMLCAVRTAVRTVIRVQCAVRVTRAVCACRRGRGTGERPETRERTEVV